jgi:hypothetical protein
VPLRAAAAGVGQVRGVRRLRGVMGAPPQSHLAPSPFPLPPSPFPCRFTCHGPHPRQLLQVRPCGSRRGERLAPLARVHAHSLLRPMRATAESFDPCMLAALPLHARRSLHSLRCPCSPAVVFAIACACVSALRLPPAACSVEEYTAAYSADAKVTMCPSPRSGALLRSCARALRLLCARALKLLCARSHAAVLSCALPACCVFTWAGSCSGRR